VVSVIASLQISAGPALCATCRCVLRLGDVDAGASAAQHADAISTVDDETFDVNAFDINA
jgi:hypothetical protein